MDTFMVLENFCVKMVERIKVNGLMGRDMARFGSPPLAHLIITSHRELRPTSLREKQVTQSASLLEVLEVYIDSKNMMDIG